MERHFRITEDGSHTLYLPGLDETYHSVHGALQESMHVFINQGFNSKTAPRVRILEIGFGTGLNALLTCIAAIENRREVFYHAVEKYPLKAHEYRELNYHEHTGVDFRTLFMEMHDSPWGEDVLIREGFVMQKEKADFRHMDPSPLFDLVYFDAFDPSKQPHLWDEAMFEKIARLCKPGAILVSYSSKGSVRRALKACGFEPLKIPGPPGKREMTRAIRI